MQKYLKAFIYYLLVAVVLFIFSPTASSTSKHNDKIIVGNFSGNDLMDWNSRSFEGNTQYILSDEDGVISLQAEANQSASAFYKKVKVNIQEYPYLNWSWKANSKYNSLNEETKLGDDYVARVYVVMKRGAFPWNTYALNYIWSSNNSPDESWPNAFTKNAVMIPIKSSEDSHQVWFTEKVNVYEDIKKYLGFDVKEINGVAVMTDADNTGLSASANYGDMYFTAQ
ncbi:MAG: DUF3047 domain-containing protein [Pseudomonadota bacterium]